MSENQQPYQTPTASFFSQVVLSALKAHLQDNDDIRCSQHLKDAVFVLSFIVVTDIQEDEKLAYMKTLLPVLNHILEKVDDKEIQILTDVSLKFDVIRLLEADGVTTLALLDNGNAQELAEKALNRALDLVWGEIKRRSKCPLEIESILRKQSNLVEIAAKIVAACFTAGSDLCNSSVDITRHISPIALNKVPQTNPENVMQSLRDLSNSLKKKIFFIHRLVSVLYSLGRVMLYDSENIPEDRKEKFEWIADLTHKTCDLYKGVSGTNAPFLWLGTANAIDVRLKRTHMLNDEEKKSVLRHVWENLLPQFHEAIEAKFSSDGDVINDPRQEFAFQTLTALRALIRFYTKAWFSYFTEDEREAERERANKYLQHLLLLARENMQTLKISSTCLVYAGKFLAARKDFTEAVEYFYKASQSPLAARDKTKFYPWLCYNFARAVDEGKVADYKEVAIRSCDYALGFEENINRNLFTLLREKRLALSH